MNGADDWAEAECLASAPITDGPDVRMARLALAERERRVRAERQLRPRDTLMEFWRGKAERLEACRKGWANEAVAMVEKAEAEVMNLEADHDSRGERLWRLAGLTGYVPCESDNDATAEMVVADALKRHDELHDAVSALVRDLAIEVDDLNANIPPVGGSRIAHLYRTTGLSDALVRLRALLTADPDPDPYSWGDEAVARSLAEGIGCADVDEVRS